MFEGADKNILANSGISLIGFHEFSSSLHTKSVGRSDPPLYHSSRVS